MDRPLGYRYWSDLSPQTGYIIIYPTLALLMESWVIPRFVCFFFFCQYKHCYNKTVFVQEILKARIWVEVIRRQRREWIKEMFSWENTVDLVASWKFEFKSGRMHSATILLEEGIVERFKRWQRSWENRDFWMMLCSDKCAVCAQVGEDVTWTLTWESFAVIVEALRVDEICFQSVCAC